MIVKVAGKEYDVKGLKVNDFARMVMGEKFQNHSDEQIHDILWGHTAYPCSPIEYWAEQLHEYAQDPKGYVQKQYEWEEDFNAKRRSTQMVS